MIQLAAALFSGILLAIPPGPATTALLERARESRRRGLKGINQILLADLSILFIAATLFGSISRFVALPMFKLAGGVFLIVFAIKFFITSAKNSLPTHRSPFNLTFFNPMCWLGIFGVIGFTLKGSELNWPILLAFEIGVFLWYLILIEFVRKISLRSHELLLKIAVAIIGMIGTFISAQTLLA